MPASPKIKPARARAVLISIAVPGARFSMTTSSVGG
jgi:hypothetical protein